jgi:Ni/Co efflux regulator RcnB
MSLLTHKGGSIMKKILSTIVAVAFVAFACPALADDVKKAVDDTKDWSKKAADDTSKATKKAVEDTGDAAKKAVK